MVPWPGPHTFSIMGTRGQASLHGRAESRRQPSVYQPGLHGLHPAGDDDPQRAVRQGLARNQCTRRTRRLRLPTAASAAARCRPWTGATHRWSRRCACAPSCRRCRTPRPRQNRRRERRSLCRDKIEADLQHAAESALMCCVAWQAVEGHISMLKRTASVFAMSRQTRGTSARHFRA